MQGGLKKVGSPGERKSGASDIWTDQVICAAEQVEEWGPDARRMDLTNWEPGPVPVWRRRASPKPSESLREG